MPKNPIKETRLVEKKENKACMCTEYTTAVIYDTFLPQTHRTAAAGAGLRTPETWACPGARPGSRRTAVAQTCRAAACRA